MENLDAQIREQMTVYAPPELKAIYTRFLKMYAKIQQEQEWARDEEVRKARRARWEREQREIDFIYFVSGLVGVAFISLVMGWIMWQVKNNDTIKFVARIMVQVALCLVIAVTFLAYIETLWMKAEIKKEAKELRKLKREINEIRNRPVVPASGV